MKQLIILGGKSHAAEIIEIITRINHSHKEWDMIGFISIDGQARGNKINEYPVLGSLDVIQRYPKAWFIPEFGFPNLADIPYERLASLVDPNVFIANNAQLGKGCIIYPNCFIGANVQFGDFVFCLSGSIINHDVNIGHKVTLTSGVILGGYANIGNSCYLGQGSNIRQGVNIGHNSLIGMGAVVIRDVLPHSVMVGNPARMIHRK